MKDFWRALRRNRLAVVGGVIVVVLVVLAVFAPLFAPWDPNRPDVRKILADPSRNHPLGTDQLGRDVLSRMLHGARVSLAVGFVSVGIATAIGIVLGALAGYNGGKTDGFIMRLVRIIDHPIDFSAAQLQRFANQTEQFISEALPNGPKVKVVERATQQRAAADAPEAARR